MQENKTYIDITPPWSGVARSLLVILEHSEETEAGRKAQQFARDEILRMGKIIEHYEEKTVELETKIEELETKIEELETQIENSVEGVMKRIKKKEK